MSTSPGDPVPLRGAGDGQPWLHRLDIAVDGPTTALSGDDGQLGPAGTGLFTDDRRVISRMCLTLDGRPPTSVASSSVGAVSEFWGAARHLGSAGPDPTVEVHRRRELRGQTMTEQIRVASRSERPVHTVLRVWVAGDGADVVDVKTGKPAGPALPVTTDGGVCWQDERHVTRWATSPEPTRVRVREAEGAVLEWDLGIGPHAQVEVLLTVAAGRLAATHFDADGGAELCGWDAVQLAAAADDPVLAEVVRTSLTDLQHLLLRDPLAPADVFAAAGTPWYLTLFGRDAIWAARMMLPFDRALAEGTLRTLARRQATSTDLVSAAEPGKILHEVRRTEFHSEDLELPPLYYGTVDATPLWVVLLVETWRDGMPREGVLELLPTLQAALGWMREAVERSPDGLLRYADERGTGLSNQGWKDSGDSMRRADGSVAPSPIALVEAQAYAVQAANGAADLLEELGEDGAGQWRAWAAELGDRVRRRFWLGQGEDRYLAMALDAEGEPVDGVGSNMGHALGTGLLTPQEAAQVVHRLVRPDLLREFGIGTLSRDNPAYNPVGYHSGSVWTHDTAIVIMGMAREGHAAQARLVARALLRLATRCDFRFPELCAGEPVGNRPVPYPASCRPQAWSAASAAVLLDLLGGAEPR